MTSSKIKYSNVETFSTLLSPEELDAKITDMIESAGLTQQTNGYFQKAREVKLTSLKPALEIAYNWRAFTKQFVFTVLAGLGTLADDVKEQAQPTDSVLQVLQTGFAIIADDLMNTCPVLSEVAPKGPDGVHYRWWQDTVLKPLEELAATEGVTTDLKLVPQTNKLLAIMSRFGKEKFGAAVQLRIVEAIAYDIVLAFRIMYSNLVINDQAVFPHRDNLSWMNAHVKAEVIHHRQATDEESGLVRIANTVQEQQLLIDMTQEYIEGWVGFLASFEHFLLTASTRYETI